MDDWPTPEQYWKAHKWEFIHCGIMIFLLGGISSLRLSWTEHHPILTFLLVIVPVTAFTGPKIWKSERY